MVKINMQTEEKPSRQRRSDEANVTSPVMRRRQVGGRLREIREEARKSLEDVAQYLECSVAKVSRIETGRVGPRVPDVRSMLDLHGASDTVREELLTLVRGARERPWWSRY